MRELAPGGKCALTFTIKSGVVRGPRVETIAVNYSTPAAPGVRQLLARVHFVVKGEFEVEPPKVILTRDRPRASIVINHASGHIIDKILSVKSNHQSLKIDASDLPVVHVEFVDTKSDESIINTDCTIYTTSPVESIISVPVRIQ